MNEILTDRKNKGNVTYRIVVSDSAGDLFVRVEKLMKVRSQERDKKTTKKLVYQKSFNILDFNTNLLDIDDDTLIQFCIDTIKKVKTND
ncbi:hypothetical protein DPO09_22570 [Salmonella enterica]|uniref:Uncharacterized protein n=1 Tax=Salmonella enterica TaxID=28901 RepID=A0A761R704_SALER|nr:hypothetical protein [Salmonella enterica]EBW3317734.1 hypothetical protein [Salmonella enterica subsp. enterica serovar Kottbus]ECD5143861.1 hypothetical protein [Salmonella enterica subsp. enterica serovar Caracas]ECF6943235.1 hypothetical protein [Salmonella enterica subsp. enterica]EDQ6177447.1 hypothetical protein [Salmonella enterica subsp. enterica serovar Minnesota]HEC6606612.1 hypothetical protein [Salmonella enterica subsp. enterica serovar Waycross]